MQEIPFSLSTPGKTQLGRLADGRFTKHKGGSFPTKSSLPCKQTPSKFVMVSIPASCGIKTTSWNCKCAARINVFSPFQEKNRQCSYLTLVHWTLFEWIKWKGFGVISDGVCVLFSCHSLCIVIVVSYLIAITGQIFFLIQKSLIKNTKKWRSSYISRV